MRILTSWDDGHPNDLKIGELLTKHGLKGTFFVPIRNSEGLPVMPAKSIRELGNDFEVGGHTLDHTYLDKVSKSEIVTQVVEGKRRLEDILDKPVTGFSYPGGRAVPYAVQTVKDAGFLYARNTEFFRTDIGSDVWHIPTTIQFYPHRRIDYMKNYFRQGNYLLRWSTLFSALRYGDYLCRLREIALSCAEHDSNFHLTGHSWEIAQAGWQDLDEFLGYLASLGGQPMALNELAQLHLPA